VKEQLLAVDAATIDRCHVVSEEVVMEMARGARAALGADVGFGITGLLSPGGETEQIPVGTVWMAVVDKDRVASKQFRFFYDRERNKEVATSMALLTIWRFLSNQL
jgi:nicotinamide-nucleotide amidase